MLCREVVCVRVLTRWTSLWLQSQVAHLSKELESEVMAHNDAAATVLRLSARVAHLESDALVRTSPRRAPASTTPRIRSPLSGGSRQSE
jgi:hypothetical protein